MVIRRPVSLRGWQEIFQIIFGEKDKRDYLPQDLLLHVQEEAAKICEGLRKNDSWEITRALPHFICWLLSLCNMVGINAEEAIWGKYQGICPYCGRKKNCICITLEKKAAKWKKNPQGTMPVSLDEWQQMLLQIYGRIDALSLPVQLWLHVQEELGELSREFRLGNNQKMQEELADSFAWLIGFCNKLGINLSEATWKVYPGKCDVCKQKKCQCSKV